MKKIAILIGVAIVLAAAWFMLIFQPLSHKADAVNTGITQARQQVEGYSQTLQQLPNYLSTSEELTNLKEQLTSSLYAKTEILKLFETLTLDASTNQLTITEISPPVEELIAMNRKVDGDDSPLFLTIELSMRGTYNDFGRFVSHLETQPYFRKVNQCEVKGNREIGSPVDSKVKFKAIIGNLEDAS